MAQFSKGNDTRRRADDALDLDALLHPAQAFAHPLDVVRDRDLTFNEKRAILASWASDACAVEAAPALRQTPQGRAIAFDDIMDALRSRSRGRRLPEAAAALPARARAPGAGCVRAKVARPDLE